MFPKLNLDETSEIIKIAVIIAITLGLVVSIFFIIVQKDSYSAIYIVPKSIIRNSQDNSVLFAYGVKSSETQKMDYVLETYLNETLVKTKQFSLNEGQILDEQDKIILPADVKYPLKVSLRLTTNTAKEEVHFWLN